MANIKNKNELKRRIELFLDELDYSINEDFCKETMKMMREFIGHASHRLDCEESRVKSLKSKLKNYKEIVQKVEREYNGGWIPCSERLPNDCDTRFYMCIVENHEEDLPMFCQYEEELGFGLWQDIYDEHTLGFVDSIFNTNEELGYEKVIAWQPLPEPYKECD